MLREAFSLTNSKFSPSAYIYMVITLLQENLKFPACPGDVIRCPWNITTFFKKDIGFIGKGMISLQ